ncbi:MAG: amino acid permease [Streptococcus salivarius]|nr:amino acid permease [Streptococcus salivarius]
MSIFRKKDVGLAQTEMKRHLTLRDVVLLGIGAMVGTGIFTITGTAASTLAGPALIISVLISAVCVGMSAIFFAEFASRYPSAGGVYGYLYAVWGEYPAWMGGWLTMIVFMNAVSSVASGWGAYLKGLLASFGLKLPQAISGPFNPSQGTYIDLLPVLVLVLVTALLLMNSKQALRLNSLLVVLKFSALAVFILVGLFHLNPSNWADFAPFGFGQIYGGKTGIMAGASLMFFGFLGFESISMTVDEIKEPQKNVPRGIVLALIIVASLYAVVSLVLTGVVHYTKLNVDDAVAYALRYIGISWAANYVSVVAIMTLITVCISMAYALSRMVYSLARDGFLPQTFKKVSKTNKVPHHATLLTGILSAISAGIFSLANMASLVNIATLAYLVLLAIALIILRKDKGLPQKDEFKVPFVPVLPIISIIVCLSFMSQYSWQTWLAFGLAVLIGSVIYAFYGYKHSKY